MSTSHNEFYFFEPLFIVEIAPNIGGEHEAMKSQNRDRTNKPKSIYIVEVGSFIWINRSFLLQIISFD